MSDEQAALDENMPPVDEAPAIVEASETGTETPAEPAPAPVEEGFVETDNDAVQARINKITAEKYAEKRRADAAAEEIQRLKAQIPVAAPTAATGEPRLEDFDYDEAAFQSALIDYKVNQKAQEIQRDNQQKAQAQTQATIQAAFNEKVTTFKEKAPDYEATVGMVPNLPQETLDAVMQSENGPQLAYYLGKHLDVADQLVNMTPAMAGIKLGQISAQLSATTQTVKTSAAPEPIEPVVAGGSLPKDLDEMSMDEIYNL